MLHYQHTPVGEKIDLSRASSDIGMLESIFTPFKVKFYDSGTSALATAVSVSIRQKNIKSPEIIIPAYSCPDLLSAIIYTGARPVLVDFEKDRPWMDLQQLQESITSETVAVIAVNFLGIPERLNKIREITKNNSINLIEDSAQFFPYTDTAMNCSGDMVVLSFGRGKPVNMLTGGALLFRDNVTDKLLPESGTNVRNGTVESIKYLIKTNIYNLTIMPCLYGFFEKLPFLHVGKTRYKNHHSINAMNDAAKGFLYHNIQISIDRSSKIQNHYMNMLSNLDNGKLINLATACCGINLPRMLRYPVLCRDISVREELYKKLRERGIGVSKMYQRILPEISGVADNLCDSQRKTFKNAIEFADRLLTLPTHSRITDTDLEQIKILLSSD